jgi:hypothetical protein
MGFQVNSLSAGRRTRANIAARLLFCVSIGGVTRDSDGDAPANIDVAYSADMRT